MDAGVWRFLRGDYLPAASHPQNFIQNQTHRTNRDAAVGHIKRRKMPPPPVEIQKIHHIAIQNPVNHIAKWVGGNYVDSCQSTIGIDEFSFSNINLFPNPASNKLFIETNSGTIQKISIYDLTGKLIKTISTNTSKQELDISTLSPGLYFLDAVSDQRTFRKRFVKN